MQQNSRYNAFSARQFFSRQRILRSEIREKTRQFLIGLFSKPAGQDRVLAGQLWVFVHMPRVFIPKRTRNPPVLNLL